MGKTRHDDPIAVITTARWCPARELATRRRRYLWIMSVGVSCIVGAALSYSTPWLAIGLLIASLPLPWAAVLIANDPRPPRLSGFSAHHQPRPATQPFQATATRHRNRNRCSLAVLFEMDGVLAPPDDAEVSRGVSPPRTRTA